MPLSAKLDRVPTAMGEVINLRQVRKTKKREAEAAKADQNRQLHGRSKSQKAKEKSQREREKRDLDGKQIDWDAPPDKPA